MDSNDVFQLRNEAKELNGYQKLDKLQEALVLANKLHQHWPGDEWIEKAIGWVLIDICKIYVVSDISQAAKYYNKLISIRFEYADEIIQNQISFLRPKVDQNYAIIKKAEDLSKGNNHTEAVAIFKNLIKTKKLTEIHHEAYGWVIYRYIKKAEADLSSVEVRTFLRDYMNLQNERPSLLHSMILNFAYHYSKEHSDFNLYNFFKLWNPENLRDDDMEIQRFEGKEIPSIVSRICRTFIDKNYEIDMNFLVDNVGGDVIDMLREPYFWKIFNANKEKRFVDLWGLFNAYNTRFSSFAGSKWHSEILSIAERFMQETEEWRFYEFFKDWDPYNLMPEDWKEVEKDDKKYKPLAVKCLKKAFEVSKSKKDESIDWLLELYETAISKYPKDEWLLRERALLFIQSEDFEKAIETYKSLALNLGDKAYIWHEFSNCLKNDNRIKIGMLAKALQLENNESFLGNIHLDLAEALFENDLAENAAVELTSYRNHREKQGWKLSEKYNTLAKDINSSTPAINNKDIYKQYIPIAEEFAYQEIPWNTFLLYDIWRNDKNKERCNFTDGKGIEFSVSKNRFPDLKTAKVGNVLELKLFTEEEELTKDIPGIGVRGLPYRMVVKKEYKHSPVLLKRSQQADWSILTDDYAVIEYINTDKKIIHAITTQNEEIFISGNINKFKVNDFIKGKRLETKRKDETIINLKDIELTDKQYFLSKSQNAIAIVDNVNIEKKLFHFVVDGKIHGIIRFNETELIPQEGDFLEIWFIKKVDKKRNKEIYKTLEIKKTDKSSPKLKKEISGLLQVKYRKDGIGYGSPDFAFVGDYYISKKMLEKNKIDDDCSVTATALYSGDKWKIIEIKLDH